MTDQNGSVTCPVCLKKYAMNLLSRDEDGLDLKLPLHGREGQVIGLCPGSGTLINRQREGDQPLPVGNDLPVCHKLVQEDLEARLHLGIARYDQPLQPHNGRSYLRDIYEEILDAAVYIRGKLYEEEGR